MNLSSISLEIKKKLPKPLFERLQWLKYFGKKLPDCKEYQSYFANKKCIEIGGPSVLFKTSLPIYQVIGSLDGVNFSNSTVWEGSIQSGRTYNFIRDSTGIQYISDATNLDQIDSKTYDCLLSSNCLEHIANPLKAIEEWKRIIVESGFIMLVLPKKESNFDHKRPITTFSHLLEDYVNMITEHDLTHLNEILALHDLSRDPPAGSFEKFRLRSQNNYTNRTLHHHVFDLSLIKEIFDFFKIKVIHTSVTTTDYFVLGEI